MKKKHVKSGWSYILVLVLTVAFIGTNVYLDFKNKAYASDKFLQVEVLYGDTIWEIANQYRELHDLTTQEFIEQVEDLNNLDADHLEEGQSIFIPILKK
jgi:cell division protein YceG involved in septum cleavage